MSETRPLHRLFGLSWIDFFQGTPITVETELDLSLKQQFVDVVLIRKGLGSLPRPLPDGFEGLAAHNLATVSPTRRRSTRGRCGSWSATSSTTASRPARRWTTRFRRMISGCSPCAHAGRITWRNRSR